jgi:hypothetical protein
MRGKIIKINPVVNSGRLKIIARVLMQKKGLIKAYMPDRELSALLPRSLLVMNKKQVPQRLLEAIGPIIRRMTLGRQVRLWQYEERFYFSFLSWREVKFLSA